MKKAMQHERLSQLPIPLLLFLAVALNGCSLFQHEPESPVAVLNRQVVTLSGRIFETKLLRTKIRSRQYDILQIAGDGMIVSFHSSTSPFVAGFSGVAISFGGHTFEVLPSSNRFRIDNVDQTLEAGGIYVFSDGRLVTQIR